MSADITFFFSVSLNNISSNALVIFVCEQDPKIGLGYYWWDSLVGIDGTIR